MAKNNTPFTSYTFRVIYEYCIYWEYLDLFVKSSYSMGAADIFVDPYKLHSVQFRVFNGRDISFTEEAVMFGRGKKQMTSVVFDRDRQRAVLRCSICTGEKVAGFKDKETGHFTEVMLIRSDAELAKFVRLYQLEESEIIKEY